MSYIESNLIPGEEVAILRKPDSQKSGSILWAVLTVLSLPLWVVFLTVILAAVSLIMYLRWHSTEYAITNKRVVAKTWILSISINEISLHKVESASMKKAVLNNFWDVTVKGTGWQDLLFKDIPNPQEIRDFLFKEIEKRS